MMVPAKKVKRVLQVPWYPSPGTTGDKGQKGATGGTGPGRCCRSNWKQVTSEARPAGDITTQNIIATGPSGTYNIGPSSVKFGTMYANTFNGTATMSNMLTWLRTIKQMLIMNQAQLLQ